MSIQNTPNKNRALIFISLLLLVLIMVVLVDDKKEWGGFCGAVAVLYAVLSGRRNKE